MKTKTSILAACFAAAILGVLLGIRWERSSETAASINRAIPASLISSRDPQRDHRAHRVGDVLASVSQAKSTVASRSNAAGVHFLSMGFASEVDAIRQELGLSSAEADRLVEIYADYQEARALFEQGLIYRDAETVRGVEFKIPAYVEAGKELRRLFMEELAAEITPQQAMRVQAKLGTYIEERFLGFGVCEQTFTVKQVEVDGKPAYQIERFAILAKEGIPHMAPAFSRFAASSANHTYTLELMKSGEYAAVGNALAVFLKEGGQVPRG